MGICCSKQDQLNGEELTKRESIDIQVDFPLEAVIAETQIQLNSGLQAALRDAEEDIRDAWLSAVYEHIDLLVRSQDRQTVVFSIPCGTPMETARKLCKDASFPSVSHGEFASKVKSAVWKQAIEPLLSATFDSSIPSHAKQRVRVTAEFKALTVGKVQELLEKALLNAKHDAAQEKEQQPHIAGEESQDDQVARNFRYGDGEAVEKTLLNGLAQQRLENQLEQRGLVQFEEERVQDRINDQKRRVHEQDVEREAEKMMKNEAAALQALLFHY